ncbi:hypothetical protein OHA21_31390 [Actinoplanes sp. NBC_00393]|uniref:hypothetical protein n=1 Tax=Actinoplanes sp. NBC_00393 TaxID=2975953 RepID=UPI002E1AFA43
MRGTREPGPPQGVLLEGTVTAHRPPLNGYPATAEIRVEAPSGPALCLIDQKSFPGDLRPQPQTRITVDYLPTGHCKVPPEPGSRWGVFAIGVFFALTGTAMLWYRMNE